MELIVGARKSPLSQKQIEEVFNEIVLYHPHISFSPLLLETTGDKDLLTSLRNLDKTDFFTREIDQLLLEGKCRIAIHSAKDLPDPLPKGLAIVAITKGIDSSDALVLREDQTLEQLSSHARIATSSQKREEAIKRLRPDLSYVDIRGTIEMRLKALDEGVVDGVVIAEAALIRLNLVHRNRLKLDIETAPLQGKLAIIAREHDVFMQRLFSCIDDRKQIRSLYLGLDLPSKNFDDRRLIHQPIINVKPRAFGETDILEAFQELPLYTHLIFTSKSAVKLFFQALPKFQVPLLFLHQKSFVAVGQGTQRAIEEHGFKVAVTAQEEQAEGVIEALKDLSPTSTYLFWPHSSLARPLITDYFIQHGYRFKECPLYDTVPYEKFKLPSLESFDEIIFTSPSTVKAFFHLYPNFSEDKIFTTIGPITKSCLAQYKHDRQK
ncbi:MAG: hydroxymethylbilane synthase [Parachlamydiaceae bacterium]